MTALRTVRDRLGPILWIGMPAIVLVASVTVIIWVPSPPSKVGRLCDEMVEQVLTTKDPVELRRAIFLVRWFDCGIRRRLP
jgi:hypothetical protein